MNDIDQRNALLWILNQHPLDQVETRLWDAFSGCLLSFGELDLLCQNLLLKTFPVVRVEGVVTKHHSVRRTSHRPHVNLGCRPCLSCKQLRWHKLQTACCTFFSREASVGTENAEVAQFNFDSTRTVIGQSFNVVGKEDILEFDVSVNDLLVVAVFKCQHQLHYYFAWLPLGHPATWKPLPIVEQLPARQVLHYDNQLVFDVKAIHQLYNIFVLQVTQSNHLLLHHLAVYWPSI